MSELDCPNHGPHRDCEYVQSLKDHIADLERAIRLFRDGAKANGERISTLEEAQRWIPVSEALPPEDVPVLVQMKHYPQAVTAAMRYDDGDGWLWGQLSGYNACLTDPASYEFDDDYDYIAWCHIPLPPQEIGE